jgi:hypothetical protein
MPMPSSDTDISQLFVEAYNGDLDKLGSAARVALPPHGSDADTLALQDDDGNFLAFIPVSTEPKMAAIAYRLYGRALNIGVRAGEEAAFAKLRHLIGAVSSHDLP